MNKLLQPRSLLVLTILLAVVSLSLGATSVDIPALLRLEEEELHILLTSRLPRLAAILIAGIGMSISGLIMQQLSRNKFVSPTTAGTMDSAKLGILVSLLLFTGATPLQKMLIAFLFALAGTLLFMRILDSIRVKDAIFIPLVGLMFGSIMSSTTTFFAYKHDLIQNISAWLQGDFSMIVKGQYELIYISIPVLFLAWLFANQFTVAGMGEEFAINLGVSYKWVVYFGLALVALMSAAVILTVGVIPFLGLIIPNIISMYQGDHLKKSLLSTALLGAVFLLFCDILGRIIIYPYEIPISLTVGVLGSGIFLYLLTRRTAYA